MAKMKRLYHATAAYLLNRLASFGSWLMRYAGSWSNHHEAKRDAL